MPSSPSRPWIARSIIGGLRIVLFELLAFGASAAFSVGRQAPAPPKHFDPAPWIEDFHRLLHEMSVHYANLDWALDERRMDLPRLRRETEAALSEARDDGDARRSLERFVGAFGDGHLELVWPADDAKPEVPASAGVCERLGYAARIKAGVDFSLLPEFSALAPSDGDPFPGGLLDVAPGKRVGVVRIGAFTPKLYPDACREAVRRLGMAESADCGETCAGEIERLAANFLTAALARRVEDLRRAGATALLVDVTRNGGGSEWVEVVPRALSPRPLRDPPVGFVKSEHWTRQLSDSLREVRADLEKSDGRDEILRRAAATLERAIAASRQRCDRDAVWTTGRLECSLLAKGFLFASGLLPDVRPGALAGLESRERLFHPAAYEYVESPNGFPLFVAVGGDTWSAAEYFAAVLQDNGAARIVGELTGGAGCGYTDGGIPATLPRSRAEVKMPDCVRFRADGTNEVDGVAPDVLVPWVRRDSPYQRARKLLSALRSVR